MGGIPAVYSGADVNIVNTIDLYIFLSNIVQINTSLVNITASTYI